MSIASDRRIRDLESGLAAGASSAVLLGELAQLKLERGDLAGALDAYDSCVALEPANAGVRNNFAVALIRAARPAEAIAQLEAALACRPGYVRALVNLGKALCEVGRNAAAAQRLREALAIEPGYVPGLINLGQALSAGGEWREARQTLERAVALAPTQVDAWSNLGIVYFQQGLPEASLDALRRALALQPGNAEAHAHLAHVLFCSGDWESAWPHFEYRFQRRLHPATLRPALPAPARWNGILAGDLELWLLGEQGLGDQLQFVRYATVLGERGIRCVIACDARLVRMVGLAGLGTRVVAADTVTDSAGACWIPLMSLPAWHRTRPDSVPASEGYLRADPRLVDVWRARLPFTPNLRVAVAWSGNPRTETGLYAGRSPQLAALAPLLEVPGIELISLQKGPGEEQLDTEPIGSRIRRFPDLDAGPDAFLDTAAVLQCVDLLVTSDTAIAHLAGGLGVPCWLCLMHEPDWRWMREGSATPWYRSMRLFRQPAPGDWASVYAAAAAALALQPVRQR